MQVCKIPASGICRYLFAAVSPKKVPPRPAVKQRLKLMAGLNRKEIRARVCPCPSKMYKFRPKADSAVKQEVKKSSN
eukprot:5182493-Amphidinium_carterae.2